MTLVGVGFRHELARWIDQRPPEIDCLEIIAEHFFEGGEKKLRSLAEGYPLLVHGLGLSLGTPGSIDKAILRSFTRVVELAQPLWVSEHISFTRSEDVDLGHLNPLAPNQRNMEILSAHAREVSEACNKPIILENIATHLQVPGTLTETDFLNRLCEAADCALLLDVTNLYINSKNHRFNARGWLHDLDPSLIAQLHVVGYSFKDGRWQDLHGERIQEDLWELIEETISYAPVQAIIIERDCNFSEIKQLEAELVRLRGACAKN